VNEINHAEEGDSFSGAITETEEKGSKIDELIRDFESQAGDSEIKNDETNTETAVDNIQAEEDALEGISLEIFLPLLPPDFINNCTSPALYIAKKSLSQDLSKAEAESIERFFELPANVVQVKKEIWGRLLKKYFPSLENQKIPPLYALILLESIGTIGAVREAKVFLAEQRHLNNKNQGGGNGQTGK
jgi:hypothetical protein